MNLIDRRFLNISLAVQGIANSPEDNPTAGIQYIIGSEPSGAFNGIPKNYIARYNGSTWDFYAPKVDGLEVLNLSNNSILRYDGSDWVIAASFGGGGNDDTSIIVVKGVGISSATKPEGYFGIYIGSNYVEKPLCNSASSCYFELNDNDKFLSLSNKKIYTYNAQSETLAASNITRSQLFFNSDTHELAFYRFDADENEILNLGSIKTLKPVDRIINAFLPSDFFDDASAEISYKNSHQTDGYSYAVFDRLYSYSTSGTWGMSTLSEGDRFLALNFGTSSQPRIYEYIDEYGDAFASAFTYDELFNGDIFLNKADGALYAYNGTTIVKIGGSSSGSSGTSVTYSTEVHTLTAQEVSNKSFSLSHFIASGKESNILCFVCGVAQAVDTDFSASGNSITWNGKALDEVGLAVGDTFIVHYITA